LKRNERAIAEDNREKRAEALRRKEEEVKSLFASVFKSEPGQKVFKNLSDFAKCGEDMFIECPDERTFAYISGRQSVLLHILKILEDK
jgi:reverse gyrase